MKIDLSTILEMVEEEDKKIKENKAPVQPKQEEATLDLQGLFSLFEELEPTLKEDTSQQIPKDLEKNLKTKTVAKSKTIPIEVFTVDINEKLGDLGEASREELTQMIASATGISGAGQVRKKLESLSRISETYTQTQELSKVMSQVLIISSMYKMLNSFQASPTGFINEAFMSAFYGTKQEKLTSKGEEEVEKGKQKGAVQIADVYTVDAEGGLPVSIKTIKKSGEITGSKGLLFDALRKHGKVLFHVYEKLGQTGNIQQLKFYSFAIDESNVFSLTGTKLSEANKPGIDVSRFLDLIKLPIEDFMKEREKVQVRRNDINRFLSTIENAAGKEGFEELSKDPESYKQALLSPLSEDSKFKIVSGQWKELSGDAVTITIDPVLADEIIEKKIKELNSGIIDIAIKIKQLTENLKKYCTGSGQEKEEAGKNARNVAIEVLPSTRKATLQATKEE